MPSAVLADMTASVTELKKDPMGTMRAGHGEPVAILNRNAASFYIVPAQRYAAILNALEDVELNAIADARKDERRIRMRLDEL